MLSRTFTWLAGAGLAVALVFAVTMVARADQQRPSTTPQATVRDFLTDAVVDHDPVDACAYLTPRARRSFEPGQDCATFFASAQLDGVTSDDGVDHLTYRVTDDGSARVVRVAGVSFVLRPASPEARSEFHAPATDWRIDSGVGALVG